jgi:hypothetical protein
VLGKAVGEGTFGTTYMSTWQGSTCAVKCGRIRTREEAVMFLREVEVLALMCHRNIMRMYGAWGWARGRDGE